MLVRCSLQNDPGNCVRRYDHLVANDHADPDHDRKVVSRLRSVDHAVQPVCSDLAARATRFAGYGPRLTAAVATLKGNGTTRLIDVLGELRPSMSFPTHNRYKKTRLDYILASPTLAISDPKIHTDEDAAPEASDHYPVSATVKVQNP